MLRKDWKDAGKPSGETTSNLEVAHIIPFIYGSHKNQNVYIYFGVLDQFTVLIYLIAFGQVCHTAMDLPISLLPSTLREDSCRENKRPVEYYHLGKLYS